MTQDNEDESKEFKLRSYQQEMVDESLARNIIVAMDTGSGKTAIAVFRTEAALQNSVQEKLVWILAPTVALCRQHISTFQQWVPGYQSRLLTGNEGVDMWQDQRIWDAALKNIRIVISTHAILRDALEHSFVGMQRISLLIFDEAHHCVGDHPGAQIMKNSYFRAINQGRRDSLPRILGLTASPVSPSILEATLDCKIVSPRLFRSELQQHVNRPVFHSKKYVGNLCNRPLWLQQLQSTYQDYEIEKDPFVLSTFDSMKKEQARRSGKTYCTEELKSLYTSSETIFQELGPHIAQWFVQTCITRFLSKPSNSFQQHNASTNEEKLHLIGLLGKLDMPGPETAIMHSAKVDSLIQILQEEWVPGLPGMIFVQKRVTVQALTELLSSHPCLGETLSIEAVVGSSSHAKRKRKIVDLIEPGHNPTLDDFRSGKKNLVIATSVLSEGIDMPTCHLVICFDQPDNIVSFMQRRGRARKKGSKYILMVPEFDGSKRRDWGQLERELENAYMNGVKETSMESILQSRNEKGYREFVVEETGATLNLDNAVSHLYHFCATMHAGPFVDLRPQFDFDEDEDGFTAAVTLPIIVEPSLRMANSSRRYRSKRLAKQDAAFEAYLALYKAQLVNENLLPLKRVPEFGLDEEIDEKASMRSVAPRFNPWIEIARNVECNNGTWFRALVTVSAGDEKYEMTMCSPRHIPVIQPFELYWNSAVRYTVSIRILDPCEFTEADLHTAQNITHRVLHAAHGGRMDNDKTDFLTFFLPEADPKLSSIKHDWVRSPKRLMLARDFFRPENGHHYADASVVWHDQIKYLLKRSPQAYSNPAEPISTSNEETDGPTLVVTKFPKRTDFLHPIPDNINGSNAYTREEPLPLAECTLEFIPYQYAMFSLFSPSIVRRLELAMVAEELHTTILEPVGIQNSELVQTAITHNAAQEAENYQRLEFLGDCILKFFTSIQLMVDHATWPEGYLTQEKGVRVSNASLDSISRRIGLDRFIIADIFTGAKWRPHSVCKVLAQAEKEEKVIKMSSKTIADVVESLIGASYIDGGLPSALKCIARFFQKQEWLSLGVAVNHLNAVASNDEVHLEELETLLDYKFEKPQLLLEAITHPAYQSYDIARALSYQRLEFLGDAVLEYLVVRRLFSHQPALPHHKMHRIKTSMVNGWFLGFLCMENGMTQTRHDIVPATGGRYVAKPTLVIKHIWQFMRFTGQAINGAQEEASKRHLEFRETILNGLQHEAIYPWAQLSRFGPDKFFSDLIESIIGAIYVDTKGNDARCDQFLEHLGLWKILDRILADDVDCLHPKEKLGHLAVSDKVKYTTQFEDQKWKCTVKVGETQIGGEVEGDSRTEVETATALRACMSLEAWMAMAEEDAEMAGSEY